MRKFNESKRNISKELKMYFDDKMSATELIDAVGDNIGNKEKWRMIYNDSTISDILMDIYKIDKSKLENKAKEIIVLL